MMSATFQHLQSYLAPEMLEGNENVRRYAYLVDTWATEGVANEMFTRTTPFRSVNISFVTTSVTHMSTRKLYLRASSFSSSISGAMHDCVCGNAQQKSYRERFSFMFVMVHEACVLLYVFPFTTSVARYEEQWEEILV